MNQTDYNKIADESRASIEHEDLKVLLPIVASIKPKNILELGTWKGYSAETWIKAFNPVEFLTIEIDSATILDYTVPRGRVPEFGFWFNTDSHLVETLEWTKQKISRVDFMFIDGDHSYAGVRQDFDMYSPLVREGGIIALHDILHFNKDPEVNIKPLWEELKIQYTHVEIQASKNSTGMGLIWV